LTIAAVHFSPLLSLPIACVLAAVLVWYWIQLSDKDVPRSRRLIRRTSLIMSFAALATATVGVSFVDSKTQQTAYVMTWAIVILFILLIMIIAVVDIFNSVRLQREYHARLAIDAAAELHRTIKHAEKQPMPPRIDAPTTNGSGKSNHHGATS